MKFCLSFMVALSMAWAMPALAQQAVFNKPIYDPQSKSYFELVRLTKADEPKHYVPSMNWGDARAFASKRVYKGTHGRLAKVATAEIHSFILMNLRPADFTWIGLRYLCNGRKLEWADGEVFQPSDFKVWAPAWDQSSGVGCRERGYMPVAYTSVRDGFRWIAKGGLKLYTDLLVEYPTGKP